MIFYGPWRKTHGEVYFHHHDFTDFTAVVFFRSLRGCGDLHGSLGAGGTGHATQSFGENLPRVTWIDGDLCRKTLEKILEKTPIPVTSLRCFFFFGELSRDFTGNIGKWSNERMYMISTYFKMNVL